MNKLVFGKVSHTLRDLITHIQTGISGSFNLKSAYITHTHIYNINTRGHRMSHAVRATCTCTPSYAREDFTNNVQYYFTCVLSVSMAQCNLSLFCFTCAKRLPQDMNGIMSLKYMYIIEGVRTRVV